VLCDLLPSLSGITLDGSAVPLYAQSDRARWGGADDGWQIKRGARPLATACQSLATPDDGMHLDLRRHFGEGLLRDIRQDLMDGYGMEPHAKWGSAGWAESQLALSDEQRIRTRRIADRLREQHWELRGRLMKGQAKLRDLLQEQTPDPKAAGSAYATVSRLYQQLLESHLQAHNDFYKLLTPEQLIAAEQQRRSVRSLQGDEHGYRRGLTPR